MGMKISFGTRSVIAFVVIVGWLCASPCRTAAQGTQGQKAVWQNSTTVVGSQVWVDLSSWWTSSSNQPDLCQLISLKILNQSYGTQGNYPNGAVIDARGVYPAGYALQQNPYNNVGCTGDPFAGLTGPPPSTTILLPSGYIQANCTWTIPNNTRIVGDEKGTVIAAQANFNSTCNHGTGYVIEMGGVDSTTGQNLCPSVGSSFVCTSVGIEHVYLAGNGTQLTVGGIDNQYSQGGSYVNDVELYNFHGTGLSIAAPGMNNNPPGATNSGPYSNILYYAYSSGDECINLGAQTQGVHGVTCSGAGSVAPPNANVGIVVDGSNNSIEDVHIEQYWDGIQIGPSAAVSNVLVSNVTTNPSTKSNTPVTNAVHLCGANPLNTNTGCPCYTNNNCSVLKDITLLDIGNSGGAPTTTVADDASSNLIVACNGGCAMPDLSTAIYLLGEPDAQSAGNPAYSKFTSSPTTSNGNYNNGSSYMPTWGEGNLAPGGATPNCSPFGAIYSKTNASGKSVWVCTLVSGQIQWATVR
jgi:hypothetical protein